MQRGRKVSLRDERDEAATGHSDEIVVVGGDDLSVADDELLPSIAGVGDG